MATISPSFSHLPFLSIRCLNVKHVPGILIRSKRSNQPASRQIRGRCSIVTSVRRSCTTITRPSEKAIGKRLRNDATGVTELPEDHIWPRFKLQIHLGKCNLGRLLATHIENSEDDAGELRYAMCDVEVHCAELDASARAIARASAAPATTAAAVTAITTTRAWTTDAARKYERATDTAGADARATVRGIARARAVADASARAIARASAAPAQPRWALRETCAQQGPRGLLAVCRCGTDRAAHVGGV